MSLQYCTETSLKRWDFFQKHHWVAPEFAQTYCFGSWQRCVNQCSALHWSPPHIASGHTLNSLFKRNESLIHCATTVVEDTFDLLTDEPIVLLITDDNGCVVYRVGEANLLQALDTLGIVQGCFFSEGKIGTNAVSLCLETHLPMEVFAADHFNQQLHPYGACAAPIFDSFGKLRGTMAMVKMAKQYRRENSVIVASCAKEISLQLQLLYEQENMNRLISMHNATMASMEDGLLSWDRNKRITMVNQQAEKLLQLNALEVIDKPIFEVIRFAPNILASFEQGENMQRKLTTVEINSEFIEAMLSVSMLQDGATLLFVHPIHKLRELAQQQIGGNAKYTFATLPARSKKMKHLITVSKRALKSKSPIFLYGEEGVGKTALAMAIHNEGEFKAGPFITVNCRAISSENMRREILGYDADSGLPSKFELAHGGTLLLEKVEYLNQELQAVLLKLLKTGLVSRSDSQRLIPVNFQLITSTSSDLSAYVAQGTFSRQLYYAISNNELTLAPLRKRKEDIALHIERILADYEKRHHVQIQIDPVAFDVLLAFAWPGNNPELKSRMERILLNRSSNRIQLKDIPDHIKHNPDGNPQSQAPVLTMEALEKKAIIQAWDVFDGKMTEMAKALAIGRTTLWRKIDKYGLTDRLKD
ncbi:PTS-dependent dihydroxyacetone kinase operon regulatory protein [Vibrio stylophorae]|uniref:PTS-dependent dihydroxyacetone kinase operon regulatory protein n=1 Tax=Vibrio stylophorae TaxID=659351 RepID=A0ABN8DT05_9VIBR|nr:dihydroxyacetone kinase operon transcriptional regulator DhaR [Vibrio stylophorae]CAH0533111.1 PTS-dependent dihydroxyacetone kinase operon regulatory protein [Vibrio stylophorae]